MAEANESSLLDLLFGVFPGSRREPGVRRVDLRDLMERDHEHGPPPNPRPIPKHGMVRWMQPSILLAAGKEVVLSGLFSRFADKRELEASLDAAWFDATGISETLWLDYASDTGDGFETTYAIASLLGEDEILVGEERLPRGHILILGGDEVYPAAEWDAYQERFVNVYAAALPDAGLPRPLMFALPGNHDWYDGLTSFMRLFCSERLIGGWQLCQKRSYFAIKLAEKRWLWAVDTQLDTYVDNAQLSYFWEMAKKLGEDDEVILVTAKPSWVAPGEEDPAWNLGGGGLEAKDVPQSWQTLAFLEDRLVAGNPENAPEDRKASVPLTLTGDQHHYAHYRSSGGGGHKITSGGAGAYLSATHTLPPEVHLPDHEWLRGGTTGGLRSWTRERIFPPADESKAIASPKSLFNPWLGVHTPTFALLTAVVYGVLGLCVWLAHVSTAVWVVVGVALTFALVAGLWAFPRVRGTRAVKLAAVHSALHLVPLAAVIVALLVLVDLAAWVALPASVGVGLVWGPTAFTLYLAWAITQPFHPQANEVFAAQSRTAGRRYKNFMRIRIRSDGAVTLYPIGVRDVPPSFEPGSTAGQAPDDPRRPWFRPENDQKIGYELIEDPIEISAGE